MKEGKTSCMIDEPSATSMKCLKILSCENLSLFFLFEFDNSGFL